MFDLKFYYLDDNKNVCTYSDIEDMRKVLFGDDDYYSTTDVEDAQEKYFKMREKRNRVAKTNVGLYTVSTVLLTIAFDDKYFETMIYKTDKNGDATKWEEVQNRCGGTFNDALNMHKETVAKFIEQSYSA